VLPGRRLNSSLALAARPPPLIPPHKGEGDAVARPEARSQSELRPSAQRGHPLPEALKSATLVGDIPTLILLTG
jgi:hypothetical protein